MRFLVSLFLLFFAAASPAGMVDWVNGVKLGKPLPPHAFVYLETQPDIAGKVVLIDFWATWCAPCIQEFPRLNQWQAQFADQGLVVIGLSQERAQEVRPFLGKHKIDYTVAVEGTPSLHKALKIKALPYALIVGRSGKVIWRGQPERIDAVLLDKLLKQTDSPSGASTK